MASCKTTLADITRSNLETAVCEMMKDTNPSTLRTYPYYSVAAQVPYLKKIDHPPHLDGSHLSPLDLDAKAYMKLCGFKSKDLMYQKHLDEYHEILDPKTVLDILDSKFIEGLRINNR